MNVSQTTVNDQNNSTSKSNENPTLKDTFIQTNTTENPLVETSETERKSMIQTYEEKRLKNYEVC